MEELNLIFNGSFTGIQSFTKPLYPKVSMVITDNTMRKFYMVTASNFELWSKLTKSESDKLLVDLLVANRIDCKISDIGDRLTIVTYGEF